MIHAVFGQVSEVLSQDKCRLSLGGWFHGPSIERPPRHIQPSIPRSPHLPRDVSLVRRVHIYVPSLDSLHKFVMFVVR